MFSFVSELYHLLSAPLRYLPEPHLGLPSICGRVAHLSDESITRDSGAVAEKTKWVLHFSRALLEVRRRTVGTQEGFARVEWLESGVWNTDKCPTSRKEREKWSTRLSRSKINFKGSGERAKMGQPGVFTILEAGYPPISQ